MAENTSADGSITWASFKKHTEAFHVLSNQQHLQVDIHLPPSLEAGKSHPLIITYHGGGLIGGDRGGYEYMSPWLPAYAAEANAIIVSPDHRLLPKASGRDVRDDLDALWKWVNSSLNSIVGQIAPEHTADLSRILVQGESAGGFCAAHLALSYPDKIRAAMLGYPMVGGFHEQGLVKQKMFPPELLPSKEELASWIKQQNALENWPLVRNDDTNFLIGLFQDQAAYLEAFGSDKDISPTYRAAEGGDATGIPERV
ncbi:MAG: hypothetical protein GOMPHAMPRED_000840 [Gomphillus americanus]|uniref:Alpha/beta hydrolase fold-3 domain-containing protein n=1 Tax=Gomphillus americanus TaxID=1940652 RepID=A0A8H3I5J5_9LECA|nr:MAG: hypothetical protein GOMPHAMPRED_000840 [Gomphillus americanus]